MEERKDRRWKRQGDVDGWTGQKVGEAGGGRIRLWMEFSVLRVRKIEAWVGWAEPRKPRKPSKPSARAKATRCAHSNYTLVFPYDERRAEYRQ